MIDLWQVIILSTYGGSQLDVQSLKDEKVCEAVIHECPIAIYWTSDWLMLVSSKTKGRVRFQWMSMRTFSAIFLHPGTVATH